MLRSSSIICSAARPDASPRALRLEDGCFCRRRHTAFFLGCKCWAPPTGLFFISHILRQDAEFVFFSGNRFILHDFDPRRPWALAGVESEFEPQPEPDV